MLTIPHKYSEALTDLPADLLESEMRRLQRIDTSFDGRMRSGLIRAELNRRTKLRINPDECSSHGSD